MHPVSWCCSNHIILFYPKLKDKSIHHGFPNKQHVLVHIKKTLKKSVYFQGAWQAFATQYLRIKDYNPRSSQAFQTRCTSKQVLWKSRLNVPCPTLQPFEVFCMFPTRITHPSLYSHQFVHLHGPKYCMAHIGTISYMSFRANTIHVRSSLSPPLSLQQIDQDSIPKVQQWFRFNETEARSAGCWVLILNRSAIYYDAKGKNTVEDF